jgi:hypothetical protein
LTDRRRNLDLEKQRAITTFYRDEFARQIEYLQASGLIETGGESRVGVACRRLLDGLDDMSSRSQFPAIAETILARFETLTQLSRLETRRTN